MRDLVIKLLGDLHSSDRHIRQRSIDEAKSMNRDLVIDELMQCLHEPDPNMRSDAAEALLLVDGSRSVGIVLPLLADNVASVRWHVCGLLHDFGDEKITPQLVTVLQSDAEPFVRMAAAYALGGVGAASAIDALRYAHEHDKGTDYEGRRVCDVAADAIEEILSR